VSQTGLTRRPIRSRESRWAAAAAGWLTKMGARPNVISVLSVFFAAAAGACLLLTRSTPPGWRSVLFVAAALGIQLRLLCNLLDGMVAIEGGRKTRSGELFNEFPDRLSDVLIVVCAGYAATATPWGEALGWAAAVLAVLTAYVRAFGASLTGAQHFVGPMAKAHRMAVMTVACLAAAVQAWVGAAPSVLPLALALVVLGCVVTLVRRTRLILVDLEAPRG
jgi:phosphatidylglycerophosphate synthase